MFDASLPADRSSAFANAPMGVALTTPAGVLVDVNPALEALLGRPAAELCGESVILLWFQRHIYERASTGGLGG